MPTKPQSKFYNDGQLSELFYPMENLPEPKWLLLGGPGSGNEAQTAIKKWPNLKGIGVELNPDAITFQRANEWPDWPLIFGALWSSLTSVPLANPGTDLLHGSVHHGPTPLGQTPLRVPGTTWDFLDEVYGPFEDAILWMDIEGSELEALQGSQRLLSRKAIMVANLELLSREGENRWERINVIHHIMEANGFQIAKIWNQSDFCQDRVYVRRA